VSIYKTSSCPRTNTPLTTETCQADAAQWWVTMVLIWCLLHRCHRIPGQYFTADTSWGVEPVNVSSVNQQIYNGCELISRHSPIILPQDAALYDDYVKEIMI